MKTELQCLPCFFGQVRRSLEYAGLSGDRGREIVRKAEALIAAASMDEVPARTTTLLHRLLRRETGVDPYHTVKETYNRVALDTLPGLRERVSAAEDRLAGAVRAAIAGNVIDFGIYDSIDLHAAVEESFHLPLPEAAYRAFARSVQQADSVLYLCDNAGEVVFDRLLLELLHAGGKRTTVAVKGSPVINDATLEDAAAAGLAEFGEVIDNGNDGIGTLLEACSDGFREAYRRADLIISKGQANFETLMHTGNERIFFLFKVKCPVVAGELGRPNGDIVLMNGAELRKGTGPWRQR